MKTQKLMTSEGRSIPPLPWNSYPRPQLVRAEWLCLNGSWDFRCDGRSQRILVPFCAESLLSGLTTVPKIGREMEYRRSFRVPRDWEGRRLLLHFGAVSRMAVVLVNGRELAQHENSYLPFTVDITHVVRPGENELRLRVINDLSHKYPWGKQKEKRGGMWYTPCSGIWQTVWLEPVPEHYIRSLSIRTGADWARITADGIQEGRVLFDGGEIPLVDGKAMIHISSPRLWSPEDPYLYRFSVISGEDRVESYFALRTLEIREWGGIPRLCLNGKPYFFHGLLDQGYWSDGLYTPAGPEAFEKDILSMKSLGFNTLRKHIKIEPDRFYYDCDRLGMIVFQDMVNSGDYRFIRDTVLPTLHLQKRSDRHLNRDADTRRHFLEAMDQTVRLLQNHPCICLWTIFNEGWGQFLADEAYLRLKELDDSRFVDSTSGWFHQKNSDVDSLHIYFGKLHLGRQKLPHLLSEFGGYVWKLPEHSFNREKTYGYRKFVDRESYVKALRGLYENELLPLARMGLCGAVYTQLSDVEDETNGLFTFDRQVLKLRPEELSDLSMALQKAVNQSSTRS